MPTDDERRWVEIQWEILPASQRSENLPDDTREVPYLGRVRGLALGRSEPGDQVDVVTLAGRFLSGAVVDTRPGYTHSFGRPLEAWIRMRESIRLMVSEDRT